MLAEDNIIKVITDSDFNLDNIKLNNPITRYASRGILINSDGLVALFHKKNKNEYKLPGGGIEKNESPTDAFKRECIEETGCKIEILDNLGTIIEEKNKNNFRQISYVYVGSVVSDTNTLSLTEKEKDEGAEIMWVTLDDAISLTNDCMKELKGSKYDDLYKSLFMVKRDNIILNYYKNINLNMENRNKK